MLNRVSIAWVWLEKNLNAIIEEVNLNRPLSSGSIAVDQTPNGSVIKAAVKGGAGGLPPIPDGSAPNWHTIQIKLVSGSTCTDAWIWYYGTAPQAGFAPNPQ